MGLALFVIHIHLAIIYLALDHLHKQTGVDWCIIPCMFN